MATTKVGELEEMATAIETLGREILFGSDERFPLADHNFMSKEAEQLFLVASNQLSVAHHTMVMAAMAESRERREIGRAMLGK